MRIRSVRLNDFRRFSNLTIDGIPEQARLVVLAGPNGCGKSSLFDSFAVLYQRRTGFGWSGDLSYYYKTPALNPNDDRINQNVNVDFYSNGSINRGSFYFRTAYRNEPEFSLNSLEQSPDVLSEHRFYRMIEGDATVMSNYRRLASDAFQDAFDRYDAQMSLGNFRDAVVGDIRQAVHRLFPDLTLNSLGNPLVKGTFRFDKGASTGFEYKNLSGGEKAAFDLILDIIVKRRAFNDTIYCIDEPEAHMSTRIQGALLETLLDLLPENSQLWVATHSIGMMRKARELFDHHQDQIVFLDFGGHDFDTEVRISPSRPTREFWERVLSVALDDLANLVAPSTVIICEGTPAGSAGKNLEHDALCYNIIFSDEFPDAKFISGGNSKEVTGDRLRFVAAIPRIAKGIEMIRLIDRDDHADDDIENFKKDKIHVLSRRSIESYLYDDEVLEALCMKLGKTDCLEKIKTFKVEALAQSVSRGNPPDDIKSAAGTLYVELKSCLDIRQSGNDPSSFARNNLAPLIQSGMKTYSDLKNDIFG